MSMTSIGDAFTHFATFGLAIPEAVGAVVSEQTGLSGLGRPPSFGR